MKKVFITAGDHSGDKHAAKLMRALKSINPGIEFHGIGGDNMVAEGLQILYHLREVSVVGFWEVAKKYRFFLEVFNKCCTALLRGNFDCFIPVDYPGFNLRLGKFAKKNGIRVVYYIAPQLWAWGKNRGNKLKESLDKLLVVFPFEEEFFKKFGVDTSFVGHPLLDNDSYGHKLPNFEERDKIIALFPGSREQEIRKHLPLLTKTSIILKSLMPDYEISIAVPSHLDIKLFAQFFKSIPDAKLSNEPERLMLTAKAGIVKTGTSNLESVIYGMPFVMFYKTSAITYLMGRYLINLPFISLANILAGKLITGEYIQKDAVPGKIADGITALLGNKDKYKKMQIEFSEIVNSLGKKGASATAAEIITNFVDGHEP